MARRTGWHTTTRAAACKGSSLQCVDHSSALAPHATRRSLRRGATPTQTAKPWCSFQRGATTSVSWVGGVCAHVRPAACARACRQTCGFRITGLGKGEGSLAGQGVEGMAIE